MKRLLPLFLAAFCGLTLAAEGMWMPHQLPELKNELKSAGLQISAKRLADLTGAPLGAVVDLAGCSASFVSPQGLVVTNHHCVYGTLQYNSSEERDLMTDGYLAASLQDELPAAPGSRVRVTVEARDVTKIVTKGLEQIGGRERYDTIEQREKELIAECEKDAGHRCKIRGALGSMVYYLYKQIEIKDVRLVYAPAGSIGVFGGDIDNWMWPRHTGDFSFVRAYVGPDGLPADPSEDNVPYKPKQFLKVASRGVRDGDMVMVVGYPGGTGRYRLATEVQNRFEWYYPRVRDLMARIREVMQEQFELHPEAEMKYASTLRGLNNADKNFQGMLDGYERSGMLERKRRLEADLQQWIASDEKRASHGSSLADLEALVLRDQSTQERDVLLSRMGRSSMLRTARSLYRLSRERQKPDPEREPGYQERDMTLRRQRMERMERRYHPAVDQALWSMYIGLYRELPQDQRVEAFDTFFRLEEPATPLDEQLDAMYAATELDQLEVRLALMDASPEEIEASEDPFLSLAVALYDSDIAREEEQEAIHGEFQLLRPRYMRTLVAFLESQGKQIYPDANGTLRVTYGSVQGYSPRDGVDFKPFTRLEGIVEKQTGEEPFDAPQAELDLIAARDHGKYRLDSIDSVPVNFLSTVDTTGGNSGSPTLNGRGELVGLLFDGTYDSINADWDFTEETTRSIQADVRYMLWVMQKLDGAERVLEEMTILEP